jgi:hypothetical protein
MKNEIILREIRNELKKTKKSQTIKTIMFIIMAIIATGSIAAIIIMKIRNGFKDIDPDELTYDDYNFDYDDDDYDMIYDITDYDMDDEIGE